MYLKKYNCQNNLIEEEIWEDYEKILGLFKTDLSLADYNINNQKRLWEHISENRAIMLKKIKKSIRMITRMCYKLDEGRQIKKLNLPLFEFNHLYDHKFYNFADCAYEGLNKFHKILKSTFGNIDLFIAEYKKLESIISFVENDRDKFLINEYNYLNNISLPISGYESLRMDLFTILKRFNQLAPVIYDEENFNELSKEINKFKSIYITEYQKRHLFYQNKIEHLKRKIFTLPLYRVLIRFNSLDGITKNDTIDYIDSFFANKCNKDNINRILLKQPRCYCGFTIGENLTIPSLEKIKPMLYKTISNHIKFLRKKLINYYRDNPESPIKILYDLNDLANLEDTNLLNIIDEELINEINLALGNKNIVKIDTRKILSSLEGTYKVKDIERLTGKFRQLLMARVKNYTGNSNNKNVIIKLVHKI